MRTLSAVCVRNHRLLASDLLHGRSGATCRQRHLSGRQSFNMNAIGPAVCFEEQNGTMGHRIFAQLGMKRHNLQPSFRESSDSLRQQAASTNLPMPFTTASGNGVYALALDATAPSPA